MSTESEDRQAASKAKPVRLRTPVSSEEGKEKCVRQALLARENRLRKKREIQALKGKIVELTDANSLLKKQITPLQEKVYDLQDEVRYLKSVLDNQTSLANLLKNISVRNVQLSSRFHQKRQHAIENGDGPRRKKVGSGVCLHVSGDKVSPELCHKCSHDAVS